MSYRLNPYKILRAIAVIAFFGYATGEMKKILNERKVETDKVMSTLVVRKKNFYNDEKLKAELMKKYDEKVQGDNSEVSQEKLEEQTKIIEEQVKKEIKENIKPIIVTKNENENKTVQQNKEQNTNNKETENKKIENKKVEEEKQKKEKELAAKKAEEEKKKREEELKKLPKKYIHAATVKTEEDAKKELARLGAGYKIKQVKSSSGKVNYQIVSISTNDPKELAKLESQAKRAKTQYIINKQ